MKNSVRLTWREMLNPWGALAAIKASRQRIHDQFRNGARDLDGKCQCCYCRGDAEQLAELAADYELQLWSLTQPKETVPGEAGQ